MKNAAHTRIGNRIKVVTQPSSANKSMNPSATVSKTPSPANRSLNASVKVSPTKH